MNNARKFYMAAREARKIYESGCSWETKYDLILGENGVLRTIKFTGIRFDWTDTDTSYEDDVTNFVSSVNKKADELEELLRR